jgi:hypothetical protein
MASLYKLIIIPMEPNPDLVESLLKCGNSMLHVHNRSSGTYCSLHFLNGLVCPKIEEVRTSAHRWARLLKQNSLVTVIVC